MKARCSLTQYSSQQSDHGHYQFIIIIEGTEWPSSSLPLPCATAPPSWFRSIRYSAFVRKCPARRWKSSQTSLPMFLLPRLHAAPKTAFTSEWLLPNSLQLSTVGDPSFVRHPRYMHRSSDRCMIISPNATSLRHCVILTSTTSNPSIPSIKKARL